MFIWWLILVYWDGDFLRSGNEWVRVVLFYSMIFRSVKDLVESMFIYRDIVGSLLSSSYNMLKRDWWFRWIFWQSIASPSSVYQCFNLYWTICTAPTCLLRRLVVKGMILRVFVVSDITIASVPHESSSSSSSSSQYNPPFHCTVKLWAVTFRTLLLKMVWWIILLVESHRSKIAVEGLKTVSCCGIVAHNHQNT